MAQKVEQKIPSGSHKFKSHLFQVEVTTKNVLHMGCTFVIDDQSTWTFPMGHQGYELIR